MSKKSISRQKKMDTRIDFTPMVDMNMLLITFFMLCTTMLKSQTLKIALPTNNEESKTEQNQNQAAESQALTIIIDGVETNDEKTGARSNPMDAKFYYYEGQLDMNNPESFKEAKGIGIGDTGLVEGHASTPMISGRSSSSPMVANVKLANLLMPRLAPALACNTTQLADRGKAKVMRLICSMSFSDPTVKK